MTHARGKNSEIRLICATFLRVTSVTTLLRSFLPWRRFGRSPMTTLGVGTVRPLQATRQTRQRDIRSSSSSLSPRRPCWHQW